MMGMGYDEFWEKDVELAKFYREAWKLRQKQENQRLWLQGAYIYEAILDAAPVLHPFAKKGTKPVPYREEPYPLLEKRRDAENAQPTAEERSDAKAKAMMEVFMVNFNRRFEQKGGEANGECGNAGH